MYQGFWKTLPSKFIGLAPMDGVTDGLYRYIQATVAKPHLMMTEFTCVEGIAHNAVKLLKDFEYNDVERPIVAQVFGTDIESYYQTAIVVCELGFDGIDINMGCPSKNVSGRGAGAALIKTPDLAKEIVRATQAGVKDYADGVRGIEDIGLKQKMIEAIKAASIIHQPIERRMIPVSIKTRIGFDKIIAEEWTSHILEVEPAALGLHGRTLKQMYAGLADWDAIGRATKLIKQTKTIAIGNGDVQSVADAHEKCERYGVDGVLIGRATFGNPWIFSGTDGTLEQRCELAVSHSQAYEKKFPQSPFFPMRKHLGWYIKGHSKAKEVRKLLMQANSSEDVKEILSSVEE
jgi:tRNA-dihydrouridine synthase B